MLAFLKNFSKFVVFLFLGLLFLTVLFFFLLNSGKFYQVILPWVVESRYADIKFQEIKIESAKYRFPDQFRFKNIDVHLRYKKEDCTINMISLDLDRFSRFFLKQEQANILTSLSSFSTKDVTVNYADLELTLSAQKDQAVALQGKIFVNQALLVDYQLNEAQIEIKGNLERLELDLLKAAFYGGDLAGQIWMENKPLTPYQANLKFTLLTTARLDEIYRELNTHFNGLISGTINVAGNAQDIESIKLSVQAVSGTKIKAWVIGWLIDYVPVYKEMLPKELKNIIKQNGFLTADHLNLDLKNSSARTLQANVNVKLRKYYLNPNYTYDISIDSRLLEVIKRVERALKTGGIYGSR